MKIKTIEAIHKMLIGNENSANEALISYRSYLKTKYQSDWFVGAATEEEKEKLKSLKDTHADAEEVLADFEQKDW